MAILWQQERNGSHYEVRAAGRTRRLYTDGIFHSQFNPAEPITGAVWDLLMLPAFFFPPNSIRDVLLLGVGGGAVIRQLQAFVRPRRITGVDIDGMHLDIAARFFDVGGEDVELIEANAIEWISDAGQQQYDLVIDDLFGRGPEGPMRPIKPRKAWCESLASCLRPGGAIVMNCLRPRDLHTSGFARDKQLMKRFPGQFLLRSPVDENAVGAFLPFKANARELRNNLKAVPGLNPSRSNSRLRFEISRLAG